METKVIKPLLRSLFLSYVLSALFLGVLAFALYKLRLRESLVNLLIFAVYFAACFAGGFFTGRRVKNRRFFWGLLSGMFYFLVLFAATLPWISQGRPLTLGVLFFSPWSRRSHQGYLRQDVQLLARPCATVLP